MYGTDFGTLWEKARVECSERIALKQVYYQGWNRSPAQVGCMRQVLRADALGRPRGLGWRGRWEWGAGWGTHVNPWLIHVNVWQKPLQYCKVISLQLIKVNGKKKKKASIFRCSASFTFQLSHPYMTSGKTIALTRWTFVGKVKSLLFNMLSRLVKTFLPRSKWLLISWLKSPTTVILEPPKIFCHCFHCFPIYFPWSDGTRCQDLSFLNVEL